LIPDKWYRSAFGSEYLSLYAHRNDEEAAAAVRLICDAANLRPGVRILDAPCGGGRHSRAFARAGMHVVGFDLSEPLLRAAAAEPWTEAAPPPAYFRADIRRIPLRDNGFDCVANLFSSFGYFMTEEENQATMAELIRLVRRGGSLVVDFMNAAQVRATLNPLSERTSPKGCTIVDERWIDDAQRRINKRTTASTADGTRHEWFESVRLYEPDELVTMMVSAGGKVYRMAGDYSGSAFNAESPRAILFAEKQ